MFAVNHLSGFGSTPALASGPASPPDYASFGSLQGLYLPENYNSGAGDWDDAVATLGTLAQATPVLRPGLDSLGSESRDCLSFDGGNRLISALGLSIPFTIAVVLQSANDSTYQRVLGARKTTNIVQYELAVVGTTSPKRNVSSLKAGPGGLIYDNTYTITDAQILIVTVGTGGTYGDHAIYRNGASVADSNATWTGSGTSQDFAVGGTPTASSFSGKIGDLAIFDEKISSPIALMAAMNDWWGIY